MANKLANLQSALDSTRAPKIAEVRRPVVPARTEAVTIASATQRQANRVGKVNIAAWLDPAFKNSIRLVQARRAASIQDLMEEAWNDLFAKYDVPQVNLDGD